jgi:hypothetical protein
MESAIREALGTGPLNKTALEAQAIALVKAQTGTAPGEKSMAELIGNMTRQGLLTETPGKKHNEKLYTLPLSSAVPQSSAEFRKPYCETD